MFILGMMSVFIGISLLAPDESKGNFIMGVANFKHIENKAGNLFWKFSGSEVKDNSSLVSVVSSSISTEEDRYDSFWHTVKFAKFMESFELQNNLYALQFEIEENKNTNNSFYFVKF